MTKEEITLRVRNMVAVSLMLKKGESLSSVIEERWVQEFVQFHNAIRREDAEMCRKATKNCKNLYDDNCHIECASAIESQIIKEE